MSIGGIVQTVFHYEDGSGRLQLRPAKRGEPTGQKFLRYDKAPCDITALNGRLIWGGDSKIMYGQTKIAEREGYTKIRFVVESVSKVIAEEDGRCEHNVKDGDWCPSCNAEYHRARKEHGDE